MKKMIALSFLSLLLITSTSAFAWSPTAHNIFKRDINQQHRIEQGVRTGQLSMGEAHRLEHQDFRIQNQEHRFQERGRMNPAERMKLSHELGHENRQIYFARHNGPWRRGA